MDSAPLSRRSPLAGWRWWLLLAGLWALATGADRLWLGLDQRLPAWDQADYLNSAVDHGRALGLLAGGGWRGWAALLDLSPKIPPLASLINGSVMAVAGDSADQASWALALWHGLLLLVVAAWGRQLLSPGFALLAAALTALAPALAATRVDYTLDLSLAATTTLALWLLGRWQAPAPGGGRWTQALAAALAVAAALLVKQSALLVLMAPGLWAATQALGRRGRRLQALAALAVVVALLLPWLHHNWITTLGGTNRAVLESAAKEGDPAVFSLASLFWYPRLWPAQLGLPTLVIGLGGALIAAWRRWRRQPAGPLPPGWGWLIGCTLAGWLLTTLSPNKDPRYIAPVLPLLLLLLARGWWEMGLLLARRSRGRWPRRSSLALLALGLLAAAGSTAAERAQALERRQRSPLPQLVERLRREVGQAPITVVVLPSAPELNQHTLTSFGRLQGGRIEGRQLGKRPEEAPLVAAQARWLVLATGDQGSRRKPVRALSRQLRGDGRFERLGQWPWSQGRQVELWRRSPQAPPPAPFAPAFIRLARGLERGPAGLAQVMAAIGPQHQLDAQFLYQQEVQRWASGRLAGHPADRDALWSLALLGVLQNRPSQAAAHFQQLARLEADNPWPRAYEAVVHLADWRPWRARSALAAAPATGPAVPVVIGLRDLSGLLCGDLRVLGGLQGHLKQAVRSVEAELRAAEPPR